MARFLRLAIGAALIAAFATAAPSADEVTSLPDDPGPLPSKHYSGYLPGNNGAQLHYYWVGATDVDASTAPVVLWTNGGPGCSSMDGWGYELGPFHFKNYNTSGANFTFNPFTWARLANVVFLENPPGVGFSYRADGNYTINDTINAEDNYAALLQLMTVNFPEFLDNDFYISGESYGGIYVPTLSRLVLRGGKFPSFKGMLVGDGVTSHAYDFNFYYADASFAYGHGFMTAETLADVKAACVPPLGDPNGVGCQALSDDFYTNMVPDVNIYDYTGHCFNPPKPQDMHLPAARRRIMAHCRYLGVKPEQYFELAADGSTLAQMKAKVLGATIPPSPQGFNVPCIDSVVMTTYLNRADVKAAIHVEPTLNWAICSGIDYTDNILDVVDIYNEMVAAGKRVLIYNGNVDMSVPYTGTRAWIEHETTWNITKKLSAWTFENSAYPYGSQQAGFVEFFENGQIWFARVNGAGHMVPQFRPAAAFDMFKRFLNNNGN